MVNVELWDRVGIELVNLQLGTELLIVDFTCLDDCLGFFQSSYNGGDHVFPCVFNGA